MGKLLLDNMIFNSHHGCFPEERIIGNKFVVDFSAEVDMTRPGLTDSLDDAVNYQSIYNIIKGEMDQPSSLLENVASRILAHIREEFPMIEHASVSVAKLNPPLGGEVGDSKVIISF